MTAAMGQVRDFLIWSGEIAPLATAKSMALLHQRLQAEASTAAWGEYFLLNTLLAALAITPAILAHRRWWRQRSAPVEAEAEARPVDAGVADAGDSEPSEVNKQKTS
jgi:hypothetical protein